MWPGLTITMCGHYYWAGLVRPVNLLHSHILPFNFNIKPSRLYWTFSLRGETMNVHVSVEVVLLCVGLLEYCWDLKYFLTAGETRQGGRSWVLRAENMTHSSGWHSAVTLTILPTNRFNKTASFPLFLFDCPHQLVMNSSFVREGLHVRNFHSERKYLRWVIILGLIMKTHLPSSPSSLHPL